MSKMLLNIVVIKKSQIFSRTGLLFAFVLLFCSFTVQSQTGRALATEEIPEFYKLEWRGIEQIRINEQEVIKILTFTNAVYPYEVEIPVWHLLHHHSSANSDLKVEIIPHSFSAMTAEEQIVASGSQKISEEFQVEVVLSVVRKERYSSILVLPIRKRSDGQIEKLEEFTLRINEVPGAVQSTPPQMRKGSSELSAGEWHKLRVTNDGVHKLEYSHLSSMGLAGANASNIRLFGMGGAMLPELAGAPRPDGLQEIAIFVSDGGDGQIDPGDFILFYGEGAGTWVFDSINNRFNKQTHLYDDHNYYFITKGTSPGLRMQSQPEPTGTPTHTVTSFRDYAMYNNDSLNLIKSGRLWVGEEFDLRTTYNFSFPFPNINTQQPVEILTSVVARSLSSSIFTVQSGQHSTSINVNNILAGYNSQHAFQSVKAFSFNTSGNSIPVTISYNKPLSSSIGWLDYIQVNLHRQLQYTGSQLKFREPSVTGNGNIARYIIAGSSTAMAVWDVTDRFNPEIIQGTLTSTTYSFNSSASLRREFVAHGGASYPIPEIAGKVGNQNLRGTPSVDMVIVSHPDFLNSANRLADIHKAKSGLSCLVVTPVMIYNEFSGGKQDPAAIRDFMKYLYDRAATPSEMPRYLLLFGDGSYDNKARMPNNTNFIPTFQSEESLHPVFTFVTDDFYGLLDDHEGANGMGSLDLGIGRIPVATPLEAIQMIDKIERYLSDNNSVAAGSICVGGSATKPLADWRNTVCIIADDEDSNLHVDQAENLAIYLDTNYRVYNLNKIYIDAYQQVSISGGHRYPEVNDAINKQMEMGALIVNYIGHGGELGWAHERILRIDDINSWSNMYHMPLFLTSTCEFSRFDDPERRSAGEHTYLHPTGGAIAMYTTTRVAFASSNYAFNTAFYQNVFKKSSGEYQRLGDIFMWSKIMSGSQPNNRNIVTLGDPALMLAYPKHKVITTHINESPVNNPADTLKALSKITVKGAVTNQHNQVLQGFNGILYPVVYDKKATFTTLANDQGSYPKNFWMQKNALYKGKVSVINGLFSFTFIVPKDIAYAYGYGKISYYAEDGIEDAHGYFDKIVVGGTSGEEITDITGPEIRLYMNDSTFVFGGTTDSSPVLLALVKDEHGINTTGSGIGHDIVAVLNSNTNQAIILNDYYESDLDSYNSGSISYGFSNLEDGPHHLSMKVWDIFNNSSEAYTEFIVASADKPVLRHVLNYPNPFTTYTEFWFEHNQPCCELDVMIEVFTVSGKLVKTIRETISTVGYRAQPVPWDGLDDYGDRLARGVYVYKVTIRNQELQSTEKFEKLVILR